MLYCACRHSLAAANKSDETALDDYFCIVSVTTDCLSPIAVMKQLSVSLAALCLSPQTRCHTYKGKETTIDDGCLLLRYACPHRLVLTHNRDETAVGVSSCTFPSFSPRYTFPNTPSPFPQKLPDSITLICWSVRFLGFDSD